MKKSLVARKLELKRLTIRELTDASGAAAYGSYHAYCSNSCSSCGHQDPDTNPCEVIAPSNGPNVCGNYY